MSGNRVLSTGEARESIRRFKQILDGPLLDQIQALNKEGGQLSNPQNWDGRLATDFRNNWPETNKALEKARKDLTELQSKVNRILQDIMQAGGNS